MSTTIDGTGLTRDRLDQVIANLGAALQAIYGTDIDIGPSSLDGQLIGAEAEAHDVLAQLLEKVYASRTISGATGVSLSRLVQLVGITRNAASYSTADVVHTGTPGTVIPDGSLIDATNVPPSHFQTVGDVTIGASGTIPGTVRATTKGPVFADVGQISAIKTPISGWVSVTNAAKVNLGGSDETDAALRSRFAASVALGSQSMVDSIYAALANIQGVTEAKVFENKTGAPIQRLGSPDLPANSIQCVVVGGLDADIASAIWTKASAGCTLVGATTVGVTDSQGIAQAIRFDRPTNYDIYVGPVVRAYGGFVVTDAIKGVIAKAIVDFGNATATIGQRIVYSTLFAPVVDALKPYGGAVTLFSIPFGTLGSFNFIGVNDISVPFTSRPRWDVSFVLVGVTNLP